MFILKLGKQENKVVKPTSDKIERNEAQPKAWLKGSDGSNHSFLHKNIEHGETPTSESLTSIEPLDSKSLTITDKPQIESKVHNTNSKGVSSSNKSKKLAKRRKLTASLKNKESTRNPPRKVEKEQVETKAKETIAEEEDSLHATMDLGGTTIPAEPIKTDTAI